VCVSAIYIYARQETPAIKMHAKISISKEIVYMALLSSCMYLISLSIIRYFPQNNPQTIKSMLKETLLALVRDLFTFSSKVIKRFIIV
jgi:hypothetical protein